MTNDQFFLYPILSYGNKNTVGAVARLFFSDPPLTPHAIWVENNIGIYLDSIYLPCQPTRSFEFVCLDSQCHKEFGSKPQIYSNPKQFHENRKK